MTRTRAHGNSGILDTYGLYHKPGWKGVIVPEAFVHPAKFSRGLKL